MRAAGVFSVCLGAALVACACERVAIHEYPFPPQPPNITYTITMRRVYDAGRPAALMTFARDPAGHPTSGTIVGMLNGWPFPHASKDGSYAEGAFTYRTEFSVTRAGADGMPLAAEGVKTIYFHPENEPVSLDSPAALSSGQPIIRDSVTLTFSRNPDSSVAIAEDSRRIWSQSFEWKGSRITPPGEPPITHNIVATYSPRYAGYVLR